MNLFGIRKKELKIMYDTLLDELISLENEYIEKTNQVRKLDKRIKTISELQYYNKQPEVILSYFEYDDKFLIVTADLTIDKNGQLNKMRFALCKLLEFNPPLELSFIDVKVINYSKFDLSPIKYLKIFDFITRNKERNKGYGQILLNEFLRYVTQMDYNKDLIIIGEFSPVDEEDLNNKRLRDYVYKKFGFTIKNRHLELHRKDICLRDT
ncbi:hypothetical protein IGI80_000050 [Enterococcus sp. DIV1420a]